MVDTQTTPTPSPMVSTSNMQMDSQQAYATRPDKQDMSFTERGRAVLTRVGDNIDLINFYAREKDWYRIFDVIGTFTSVGLSNIFARYLDPVKQGINKLKKEHSELTKKVNTLTEQRTKIQREKVTYLESLNGAASDPIKLDQFHLRETKTDIEASSVNLDRRKVLEHLEKFQGKGKFYGNLLGDLLNTVLQLSISKYSAWWEKKSLVQIFEDYVKQEQSLSHVSYNDLKRSKNPIIQRATSYYDRKDKYRTLPDYLGLIRVVPLIGRLLGKESKFYWATKWLEGVSGVQLGLGAKTAFFTWYFVERQTGGYYQFKRIWNKTEGVLNPDNRNVNQSTIPGELVTQEEIAKVYREVAHDRGLQDFSPDDPLTGRIFAQTAMYLNHHYIPKLLQDKKPDLNFEEFEGTAFNFSSLVELYGTAGINIKDSYATAVRLEVLAHKGFKEYREVDAIIKQFHRPEKSEYPNNTEFRTALIGYMDKLDRVAEDHLGDKWPKKYIVERIRPGLFVSFNLTPDYKFMSAEQVAKVKAKAGMSNAPIVNAFPQGAEKPATSYSEAHPKQATDSHTQRITQERETLQALGTPNMAAPAA